MVLTARARELQLARKRRLRLASPFASHPYFDKGDAPDTEGGTTEGGEPPAAANDSFRIMALDLKLLKEMVTKVVPIDQLTVHIRKAIQAYAKAVVQALSEEASSDPTAAELLHKLAHYANVSLRDKKKIPNDLTDLLPKNLGSFLTGYLSNQAATHVAPTGKLPQGEKTTLPQAPPKKFDINAPHTQLPVPPPPAKGKGKAPPWHNVKQT